jgi:hypothetical protein
VSLVVCVEERSADLREIPLSRFAVFLPQGDGNQKKMRKLFAFANAAHFTLSISQRQAGI